MKSVLLRTCSTPVQCYRTISHTTSIPSSSTISFQCEYVRFNKMKQSNSDTDLIRSDLIISPSLHRGGSNLFPGLGMIVEVDGAGIGNGNENANGNHHGGKGKRGNSSNDGNNKMEEYYQEMLKSNPGDSLLLRNYGKYLHEVEKNVDKAEEYYGRAILASPGDGELLSLYGNLIWENSRDEDRAQLYFDQAVNASPNDCVVLGSYAHFLWQTEDDEDGEEITHENGAVVAMVGAN